MLLLLPLLTPPPIPAAPAPPPPRPALQRLADVVDDESFRSLEGKSKHQLWLELCDLITKHPDEVKVRAAGRQGTRRGAGAGASEGACVCVCACASASPLVSARLPLTP